MEIPILEGAPSPNLYKMVPRRSDTHVYENPGAEDDDMKRPPRPPLYDNL